MNTIEEYMLRNAGGDRIADLAVAIAKKDPVRGEEFSTLLKNNPDKLEALDKELQDKPGLADGLLALLDKDPEKLKSALPSMVNDPSSAGTFVSDAGIVMIQDNATPAAKAAAEKALAAGVGAAVRKSSNPEPDDAIRLKLERLHHVEGFGDLMKSIGKNPAVADMFKRLTDGSALQQEQALDGVLAQTDRDPQAFKKMLEMMKNHPGAVNSLAAGIANDRGLVDVNAVAKGGAPRILDTLLSEGGMDKVIDNFLEVPGDSFATSRQILQMGNKGPGQVVNFINGTGAKPESIITIDAHSAQMNTQSGSEFVAWAESEGTAATASTKSAATSKPKAPQG